MQKDFEIFLLAGGFFLVFILSVIILSFIGYKLSIGVKKLSIGCLRLYNKCCKKREPFVVLTETDDLESPYDTMKNRQQPL